MNNPITKKQIQKINIDLRQMGLFPEKSEIIFSFTNKRTTHISEMSIDEARMLIKYLDTNNLPKERLKRNIIHLGYRCGLLYGETETDKKINIAKLNLFLKQRGSVKKDLDKMTIIELNKTKRQFEAMLVSNEKNGAAKATKALLKDLNLEVEK